jgi:hypothetical protein
MANVLASGMLLKQAPACWNYRKTIPKIPDDRQKNLRRIPMNILFFGCSERKILSCAFSLLKYHWRSENDIPAQGFPVIETQTSKDAYSNRGPLCHREIQTGGKEA